MWRMFCDEMIEAGWALRGAGLTAIAAIFGKRSHDGRVITLGRWKWFPDNVPPKRNQ